MNETDAGQISACADRRWVARRLNWNASNGEQILVAMNGDGSPSVSGRVVSSAATLQAMPTLAAGVLTGGVVLLAAAIALVVQPIRRARRPR